MNHADSSEEMIIAKDQFLSWAMISSKRETESPRQLGSLQRRFFQARYALYHALRLLQISDGARALLPAYVCRAAVDPFIASGVEVDFYEVDRRCEVSLTDLERRITPSTKALMIVHYFGFPQRLAQIRKLCDAHGIALIEDCAHVLTGDSEGKPIGGVGDASVFSWRKFFPVFDGAELVLNRPNLDVDIAWVKESPTFTLKVAANTLEAGMVQAREPLTRLAYRGLCAGEALFRRCAPARLRKAPMMQAQNNGFSFDDRHINWPMTRVSRWTKAHSNVRQIVAKRRSNYLLLLRELSGTAAQPLFPELPQSVCPWIFPLLMPGLTDAHLALRRRGIPAVNWAGVRHPQILPRQFADSDFLYDNLVFLPVHQCLKDDDIRKTAETVKELYAA